MRATISTATAVCFLSVGLAGLVGCGGRTLLDDPSDELPLTDKGNPGGETSGSDAGSTSKSDAGSTSADAGKGGGSTIACGTTSCNSATEECCATMTGAMSGAATCTAKGMCTGGVVVTCQSAADCSSGDVCCGALPAGGFSLSDVSLSCTKTSCATGGFQLCAKDSECPKGVTCQASGFGPSLCGGISSVLSGFGGATGATTAIP